MRQRVTNLFLLCLISLLGTSPILAHVDEPDSAGNSLFDQFQANDILEVTLTITQEDITENRKNNDFFPATFAYVNVNGQLQQWNIEVRNRGKFRRMTCDMPPLKLKFPKSELRANGYKKHNDFKLVTHCLNDVEGQDNVLREYLAYRLYATLTDQSLRTQLVKITYIDPTNGRQDSSYGFLIEDTDELKERLAAQSCETCYSLPAEQFQTGNLQIHALFQYMIGNVDWSVAADRNLKIIQSKATGEYIVVPYDFDFSGLVNPSYARLSSDYQQERLRDRIFLAQNWAQEDQTYYTNYFKDKQAAIMQTVQQFDLLSKRSRKDIQRYLTTFFEELDQGIEAYQPIAQTDNTTK